MMNVKAYIIIISLYCQLRGFDNARAFLSYRLCEANDLQHKKAAPSKGKSCHDQFCLWGLQAPPLKLRNFWPAPKAAEP